MFSNLSKRDRILLVVLSGLVLIFILYKIVITTQWPQFQKAKQELEAVKAELLSAQAEAATLGKLEKRVAEAQENIDRVKTLFEIKVNQGAPFMQLGVEALGSGIQVLSLYPEPVMTDGLYHQLPLKLTIRGSYSQVMDFIYRAENMASLAEISTVKLTVDAAGTPVGEESQVLAEMTMHVYGAKDAPLASIPDERLLGRAAIFDPIIRAAMQVAGSPDAGSGGANTGTGSTGDSGSGASGSNDQGSSTTNPVGGTGSGQPAGDSGTSGTGTSGNSSDNTNPQGGTGEQETPIYK
ncbi:MAG: type IV pilus inner membrane component PilO [Bacillota bacterium]